MLSNDSQLAKRLKEIDVELAAIRREKESILLELGMTEEVAANSSHLTPEEQAYLKTMESLYDQEIAKKERTQTKRPEPLPSWALFCK